MKTLFGEIPEGIVYLIQYSNEPIYKIGHTSDFNKRYRRISTSVPHQLNPIWCINTDSPKWLERYWHIRFLKQRRPGSGIKRPSEWFDLSDADVYEFKTSPIRNEIDHPSAQLILTEQEENSREVAIRRVVKYFDELAQNHPRCIIKLANSCNYQIGQLNTEVIRLQNAGRSEESAILSWEQRAYRAADKKVLP